MVTLDHLALRSTCASAGVFLGFVVVTYANCEAAVRWSCCAELVHAPCDGVYIRAENKGRGSHLPRAELEREGKC